jgi:hypothetical protein
MPPPETDLEVQRVTRIARILDHYWVDPILGFLLPGVGDLVGAALGLYTVALAVRRKMSPVIIARMLLNLSIDAALGVIPIIGDATDIVVKANEKNVALLSSASARGGHSSGKDKLIVVGAVALFLLTLAAVVYAFVRFVHWIVA